MSVFLRGIITPDYLPTLREFFLVGPDGDIPVPAILDTGFSGMVVLPRSLRSIDAFEFTGITRYELADGAVISTELYKTTVRIGERAMSVETSFTDSALGMIGMALIDGKRAVFNLKNHTFRVFD